MTLRGRLTAAFLVVVLGPVLLGSIFVAFTVATVNRDRTADRLDRAAATARSEIGSVCRDLQAAADAVAVVPAASRSATADQLVARGLATDIRIGAPPSAGWRNCATPGATGQAAIAAVSTGGQPTITAAQRVDGGFLTRLAASTGATVTLGRAQGGRTLEAIPGQPLDLTLSVQPPNPGFLYAVLLALVLGAAAAAILVARWLARETTRPIGDLAKFTARIADGELDTRVPLPRTDELGRLAATFNRMTRELQAYVQALTASRDQLRGQLAVLGETLSSTHDVTRILQVIVRTAIAATGARAGAVFLKEKDNLVGVEPAGLRLAIGEGVLGAVAADGVARRGAGPCGPGEPPCLTYVAVPIRAPADVDEPGEKTLGVLALYDRVGDAFDDADLHTLRTFAGQAGVAVHNVRVHEEAQRLSLTDPLTGLWNYRYLRESLRREVERASRFGRMLAVLVLDLDHFKDVNDTYGHAAGDAVLAEFARRIRIGLRDVDVAFRQGGEEFVVLLPETDAFGGAIVAERLGAAVRERPVTIDPRRPGLGDRISITVSIGVAVFPEHGATAQRVLGAADDALYAAKNSGRDTFRLADPEDVSKRGVSPIGPEGQFDAATAASGGPQPPRRGGGR